MTAPGHSPIYERVLEGGNVRLRRLAAEGILPVPPEELTALQVRLVVCGDPEIEALARESLNALEIDWLRTVLRDEEDGEVLTYFCAENQNRLVREVALQNRALPVTAIERIAEHAEPEIQEIILLRQDLIVEEPAILGLLESNPELSRYSRRRIAEYRQHLFYEAPAPLPPLEPLPPAEDDARGKLATMLAEDEEVSDEEAVDLLDQIDAALAEVEPEGEVDENSKLTEAQIRALPAAVKMKLARGASRTVRGILLKDPSPQVSVAALQGSAVTESEVEMLSSNRYVCDELLSEISRRREFVRKYTVVHNLVRNPKTPPGIAIKLLPRLSVRDLARMRTDRNIPDAVRQKAVRMHMSKSR